MTDPAAKDDAATMGANIETIRRGHDAKIQGMKHALAHWAAEAQV